MRIGSIFALHKIEEKLFTIQYEESQPHVFEELFDNWNDIEYLFDFFHNNISDLNSPYWSNDVYKRVLTVEEAIEITINQAEKFEKYILSLAKKNKSNHENELSKVFVRLLKPKVYFEPLESAFKGYGVEENEANKSWLRIYAVKIDDTFVITGGAIKLTRVMQDRPHTVKELDKLKNAANELRRNYFIEDSAFDFVYFEI